MAAEDWLPSDVEFEPLRDAMDRIALEMQHPIMQRPIRYICLYRNRPRPLRCRYCNQGGFHWTTHRGKYRLAHPNGDLHSCRAAAEHYARRRRQPWQYEEELSEAMNALIADYEAGKVGPSW